MRIILVVMRELVVPHQTQHGWQQPHRGNQAAQTCNGHHFAKPAQTEVLRKEQRSKTNRGGDSRHNDGASRATKAMRQSAF